MRRVRSCVAMMILLSAAVSVASEVDSPSDRYAPIPGQGWPTATPTSQGLSEEKLSDLVRSIREDEYPGVHSLLIVKNGFLVLEEYFMGWEGSRLHTLQSVSKSITSALIGIAIEQESIRGVDEKILSFFPKRTDIKNLDSRKHAITLEDLLTMRSGTDYHERGSGAPHFQLNALSRGWDRFYLDRPMVRDPGSYFQYDSGGVILMSSLLNARTGLHADAYADEYLFAPLGITRTKWFRNQDGHPHTGGGLDLRPSDMARFGLLYLRGGRWGTRQVVPAEWVEASLHQHVELTGRDFDRGYGYLWWILKDDSNSKAQDKRIFAAQGFMGQYIFLVPGRDLVVVVTAGARGRDQDGPVRFLYSHILTADGT
ncbi:MAG: serine hydrolase [bacterium]|nr:serine hydrolase [bacterium]